jgi:hypothetical protein
MLKLLLSEEIATEAAADLRRRCRVLFVQAMTEWEGGNLIGQEPCARLKKAASQQLTLVTYNRLTISILLKSWADQERAHGGVIFLDEKAIPPRETGSLALALAGLAKEAESWDWTDRVFLLR